MSQTEQIALLAGRDAVLLLHGLAGCPLEMRYLAKALHKRGLSVFVPYISGYGCSGSATAWQDWQGATLEILERLKRDYRTVAVSGLCIGAVLALSLAIEKNRDIAALSLLSTTIFYDGWSIPWYRFLLPLGYYTPLRHFYSYREREPYGVKNELLRRHIARSVQQNVANTAATSISMNHIYQATGLIRHVVRHMGAIEAPTLVVHAIDDDTASVRSADFVVQHIGSAKVRKILLDDCYHLVTMDNERETVARETGNFFLENIEMHRRTLHTPAFQSWTPVRRASS